MEEKIVEQEPKKKRIWLRILLVFLAIIALFWIYLFFIEPKMLVIQEYAVVDEMIPDSFNGFKIVQFSDIHFGRTTNEQEVTNVVEKINLLKPDILVFTGDLFDEYITLSDDNIAFLKESLKATTATLGKYAIKGDSDYLNIEKYEEIMKESGFTILDSRNVPIYYLENTPIYLSGISSITKQEYDLTKALTKEAEGNFFQILLTHEPIIFQEVSSSTRLVLAGHSLGGLIRIPYTNGLFKKDNTGDYQVGKFTDGNAVMYVSNGIGTEDFSARFLNIPSISLYRLYNYE